MRVTLLALLLAAACSTQIDALPISGELVTTSTSTTSTTTSTSTSTTAAPVTVIERPMPSTTTSTTTSTSTTSTTTTAPVHQEPGPTLTELIHLHFLPDDWPWAHRVAMCESSATGKETFSSAVNPSSGSAGWYQHLPKFWIERTEAAGIPGASIWDPVAQVRVAAYLFYDTPQGAGHWYPSQSCWTD